MGRILPHNPKRLYHVLHGVLSQSTHMPLVQGDVFPRYGMRSAVGAVRDPPLRMRV